MIAPAPEGPKPAPPLQTAAKSSPTPDAPARTPLLVVEAVSKRFPGVVALDAVNLTVDAGEVVAVIGENGAGKSTLMKILAGVQTPDSGRILWQGQDVQLDSPRAALDRGIALIHQELNLCDNLDIAANLALGRERRGLLGTLNNAAMRAEAERVLKRVGLNLSPRTLVGDLSIAQKQLVEIAKALLIDARLLIMDEPTSSLSARETENLYRVIRELKTQGVAIVYISHRLGEVRELADRVVGLRDGRNAGNLARHEIDHERMVKLMVGRDVSRLYHRTRHKLGQPALVVRGLETTAHPGRPLEFAVRAGEIVGLAGLVGSGRTEVLLALFGIEPAVRGAIEIDGRRVLIGDPQDAIKAGLALVPEDRKQQGVILEMAVRANIGLAGLKRHQTSVGLLPRAWEKRQARAMIERLRIKTPDDRQPVGLLSGGNQQKVALGKWLTLNPKVLMLDEPTRGIDIGAKEEIYKLMEELAARGTAILFVSSEMEEALGVADRLLVMHEGRITGELAYDRQELTEERVMDLATGRIGVPPWMPDSPTPAIKPPPPSDVARSS